MSSQWCLYTLMVIFSIGIIIALSYVYWMSSPEFTPKFNGYLQVLTLCIFLITGMISCFSFYYQNHDRDRQNSMQNTTINQSTLADIDRVFMTTPALNRLYGEIYQHDPLIVKWAQSQSQSQSELQTADANTNSNLDQVKLEHQMANLMFQKMSDIYAISTSPEWTQVFQKWMKSPILRRHWIHLKSEYSREFQQWVDTVIINKIK
jgi:hypothetical protein